MPFLSPRFPPLSTLSKWRGQITTRWCNRQDYRALTVAPFSSPVLALPHLFTSNKPLRRVIVYHPMQETKTIMSLTRRALLLPALLLLCAPKQPPSPCLSLPVLEASSLASQVRGALLAQQLPPRSIMPCLLQPFPSSVHHEQPPLTAPSFSHPSTHPTNHSCVRSRLSWRRAAWPLRSAAHSSRNRISPLIWARRGLVLGRALLAYFATIIVPMMVAGETSTLQLINKGTTSRSNTQSGD